MLHLARRLHDFYIGVSQMDPSVTPPVNTSSYEVYAFYEGTVANGETVEVPLWVWASFEHLFGVIMKYNQDWSFRFKPVLIFQTLVCKPNID